MEYIDIAKGIGILSVILGHCDLGEIQVYFYIYHLPLFFIISGVLFKNYDIKTYLDRKGRGLIIPFVCCGTILAIFNQIFAILYGGSPTWSDFIRCFVNIVVFQKRMTTLWFLAALICGIFLFKLYVVITREKNDKLLFIVCYFTSLIYIFYDMLVHRGDASPLAWNFDTACIIQIYLVTGYFWKKYNLIEMIHKIDKKRCIEYSVLCIEAGIILTYLNRYFGESPYEMYNSWYGIFPFTIGAAILVSMAILMLSTQIHCKWLQHLGQHSMTYMAFHQSIGIELAKLLMNNIPVLGQSFVVSKIFIFGMAMGTSYLLDAILRKSKLRFIVGVR